MPLRWDQLAEEASRSVQSAGYGYREKVISSHAQELGVSAQTLRRSIAANEFAKDFFGRTNIDLRHKSLGSVEALKKWFSYDPKGAVGAAKRLVENNITVRGLIKEELELRMGRAKSLSARLRTTPFKDNLLRYLRSHYPSLTFVHKGCRIGLPTVDFAVGNLQAFIAFSENSRIEKNNQNIIDTIFYAKGLLSYYEDVFIYFELEQSFQKAESIVSEYKDSFQYRAPQVKLYVR